MKIIKVCLSVLTIMLIFSLVACNNNELLEKNDGQQKNENIGNQESNEQQDVEEGENQEEKFDVKEILINNEWQCDRVTDMDLNELEMRVEFGSASANYPGSLKFNEDGTFTHILPGITSDETETEGTYVIVNNDIYLTYNDGKDNIGTLFIMKPESDSELSLIDHERGYRMYFIIK